MNDSRLLSLPLLLVLALGAAPPVRADEADETVQHAEDAFGSRIGIESIGLYSESLVRGFNLQQAGNYLLEDAYFVRAASPPDTLVEGSRIRVGPNALALAFPAPSGIVQYRLLPADRSRARVELGFQHLLDSNPRPYLRAHFAHRPEQGALSLAGGAIASPSARYIFGNQARYHGIGLIPRLALGEAWQATAFYSEYEQRYEADVGFTPDGARMPRPDRLTYLGQSWSRYHTRNTTYGAIVGSAPRGDAWDYSFSAIHSRAVRPRSDYNIFSDVTDDGWADAAVSVARNRGTHSRAYQAMAARDRSADGRQDRLTLLARLRRSSHISPQVERVSVGRVSVFEPVPQRPEPAATTAPQARAEVEQREIGATWQRLWSNGAAANIGARAVALDEAAMSAAGAFSGRESRTWLYHASAALPLSPGSTAFASFVRGIEEAGVAPQHASNAYEVLPPVLARQSELGLKWRTGANTQLIGTLFEIAKPEPGFDAERRYRYLSDVRHRGVELSLSAEPLPGLRTLFGATWMRARLDGEAVEAGSIGTRPVGRAERLLMSSLEYRPAQSPQWSVDVDATYEGPRPADAFDRRRTAGYALVNIGARYRFRLRGVPATVRLRVHNVADRYAWYAQGGGMQAYEPARRILLSLALGE